MKGHYKKVKPLSFPEPKATVQYGEAIGPQRPKSAGESLREGALNWVRGGLENFKANASRREREPSRGKSHGDYRENNPLGGFLEPSHRGFGDPYASMYSGHGGMELDLNRHPYEMYGGERESERRERKPRRTVVTRTEHYYK